MNEVLVREARLRMAERSFFFSGLGASIIYLGYTANLQVVSGIGYLVGGYGVLCACAALEDVNGIEGL